MAKRLPPPAVGDVDPAAPLPEGSGALTDSALRGAFGFDKPDAWLDLARQAVAPTDMGALGPYRLIAQIGRGGQGAVYRALQPGTNREVALKRLVAGALAGPEDRSRFEREVQTVAALSHPGIVTVFGADEVDGQPLLLMELVEGDPIDRWAAGPPGGPRRAPAEILAVFEQVCRALSHAHQRAVIHRDLKPSNILVETSGRPRLLDFGLARAASQSWDQLSLDRGSSFLGTPAYAAPEQLAGDQTLVDTRTDIYALGAVLFALLCGRPPFGADGGVAALFDRIRSSAPPRPSSLVPDLARDLDSILLMALAKDPQHRYQTVDAFASDIRLFLEGAPVAAHPPGALYSASKFIRLHPLGVALGLVGVIGVTGLSIASSVLAFSLQGRQAALSTALEGEHAQRELAEAAALSAERARDEAQNQSRRHQTATDFLASTLSSIPQAARNGLEPEAKDLIDRAAARLQASELANQPEVEASMLYLVGRAYQDLGYPREAEPYVARCRAACEKLYGREHPETARAMYMEALLIEHKGRSAEAIARYSEARDILHRTVGEENLLVAMIDNNLGCVLRDTGQLEESEARHRRALDLRQRLLGPRHAEVAMSLRNLALTLAVMKRFDEARELSLESIAMTEELFGPLNAHSLHCRNYLGRILQREGRVEEALEIFVKVVDDDRRLSGKVTRNTATYQRRAVAALLQLDRPAEALERVNAMIEIADDRLADDHAGRANFRITAAECLFKLGRPQEADARLKQALALAPNLPEHAESIARRAAELRASYAAADAPAANAPRQARDARDSSTPAQTGASSPATEPAPASSSSQMPPEGLEPSTR